MARGVQPQRGMDKLEVGMKVGAARWPADGGQPWAGVVLDPEDPRAWAGSIAFGSASPDPAAVRRHVAWCRSQGLLGSEVPVLWDFGRHGPKVFWERAARVRPYDADLAAWRAETQPGAVGAAA